MSFTLFIMASALSVVTMTSTNCEAAVQEPGTPPVDQIFETLRDRLSRVRTISFKSVTRSSSPTPQDPKGLAVVVNRSDAKIKGPKFVVSSRVENSLLPNAREMTLAFDGQEYQNLDPGRSTLSTSRDVTKDEVTPVYFGPTPITVMFTFALDEIKFQDFEALKQGDLWGRIASGGRVVGRESIGSLPCVVVQVDELTDGRSAKLHLAEDLGYYPMRVEYHKGILDRVDTVDEYETVVDGDATIVVPTKTTTKGTLKTTTVPGTAVLTVVPGTLEVNRPIRDSVFTLPKNQVATRYDGSTGTAFMNGKPVKERGDLVQVVDEPGPALGTIALWASAGLIALGVGLAVWQKSRSRGTPDQGRR